MTAPRVLVTGDRGYIGSVMAPLLVQAGYDVVGVDADYYRGCDLVPPWTEYERLERDVRDLDHQDLIGFDAVIHLAALSNDPVGNLNEGWTTEINELASVRLASLARDAGVARFIFSSSCIMYGLSSDAVATEESPLDPQTEYARSKVAAERAISQLAIDGFSPVFLRNGTVYGLSPRMRFDTVLNDLVASAVATRRVTVFSDGMPWRPVVHVEDVARAFAMVLAAPAASIHNQAFNTGSDDLNHQVKELAEIAAGVVPGVSLEILGSPGADQRTYRASFAKFSATFPEFTFNWNVRSGSQQLAEALARIGLTEDAFRDDRFTRLRRLRWLLANGSLDARLRWVSSPAAHVV